MCPWRLLRIALCGLLLTSCARPGPLEGDWHNPRAGYHAYLISTTDEVREFVLLDGTRCVAGTIGTSGLTCNWQCPKPGVE